MGQIDRGTTVEFQERASRVRPVPSRRSARSACSDVRWQDDVAFQRRTAVVCARSGNSPRHSMTKGTKVKLYGFWRSLATYRVRAALALKGIAAEQVSINLLQGAQHRDDYKTVNPQSVVPALVVDSGPPLFQSLAILEYLEETHPEPPLLPRDPRGRARVRGLALIVACDAHPLIVP